MWTTDLMDDSCGSISAFTKLRQPAWSCHYPHTWNGTQRVIVLVAWLLQRCRSRLRRESTPIIPTTPLLPQLITLPTTFYAAFQIFSTVYKPGNTIAGVSVVTVIAMRFPMMLSIRYTREIPTNRSETNTGCIMIPRPAWNRISQLKNSSCADRRWTVLCQTPLHTYP